MTEIAFHVNAPDKLDYACRLLRATQKKSAQVLVLGHIGALKSLSSKLWAMAPTEFLPHCLADAAAEVIAHSPIVFIAELGAKLPQLQQNRKCCSILVRFYTLDLSVSSV